MTQYWDKMWDERFELPGYYYGTEPNDFLRENSKVFKPKGKILCLAEGEGRNAVFLAGQGFDVTAVDGSQAGMVKMRELAQERKVSVAEVVSDLADFDFGTDRWDGIVAIWCHLPKELLTRVLKNASKSLTLGGSILIEAYTPKQLEYKTGGPHSVDLLNQLHEFQRDLKGLKQIHGIELERDIYEGKGHTGRSAVVQFIARREQ